MNTTAFYHPTRQFQRALYADLQLYSVDLLFGGLYPLVGFYMFRYVGHSQVYEITWPFLMSAAYLVYLTWRICKPEIRVVSAAYYFNRPLDRVTAFWAHVTFLLITALWLLLWVGVGCALKLGGAGLTACYRLHPEFLALPLLAVAVTLRYVYAIDSWTSWGISLFGFALLIAWLTWKIYSFPEAQSFNNYWPERTMSLTTEIYGTLTLTALAAWITMDTQKQWRTFQIGGIR